MIRYPRIGRLACLLVLSLAVSQNAEAEVTFFGSVSPDPPGDGDVESALIVGLEGDANSDDFRGYVRIDNGSQIEYDSLIIGDDDGRRGEVLITGSLTPGEQSLLRLEESGSSSIATAQIGHEGFGQLTVGTGSSLAFESNSADLVIGVETTGVGITTVTGDFALIVVPGDLIVGDEGLGRLEILNGGMVSAPATINTILVGAAATGSGTVVVDGAGSIWKLNDNLTIGNSGDGSLLVSNNGLVDIDGAGDITLIGPKGRLELDGGVFAGAIITANGWIGGSGQIRGAVANSVDALIDVPPDAVLQFTGGVSNQGSVRIRHGEAVFDSTLTNLEAGSQSAPGRITLESGRLRFAAPLVNDGVLALLSGTNHVHGEIDGGDGVIAIASDTVGTFYAPVDIGAGTLELLAGSNALFLADLTFESGSTTALELADEPAGSAAIRSTGLASLAGDLLVELAGGFAPDSGDSFEIVSAAEGVSGTFGSVTLPALNPGLFWNLDYGPRDVVLEVLTAIASDFNLDGKVDALDLAIWEGSYGADADGDATGDGVTTGDDFIVWQQQLATTASPAALAVPEPAICAMLLSAAALAAIQQRRRSA